MIILRINAAEKKFMVKVESRRAIWYRTSVSVEAFVAYATPGDFAGEMNIFEYNDNNIFCFLQIRGDCGGGEGKFRCRC